MSNTTVEGFSGARLAVRAARVIVRAPPADDAGGAFVAGTGAVPGGEADGVQAAAVTTAQAAKTLEIRRERIRPPALGKGG
jgi:tagatose-1,6-bisphosphate aldolase non-catalytic subunit AgaZ/GatZ